MSYATLKISKRMRSRGEDYIMMLGPMKKKMITVGIVTFIIPCVIFGLFFGLYSSKKKAEIADLGARVADGVCYGFATDLPINHVVTSEDIIKIDMKEISIPYNSYIYQEKKDEKGNVVMIEGTSLPVVLQDDFGRLVGKKLKIPVSEKTVAIESMFFTEEDYVARDVRSKEYNSIVLPSDLNAGDVVDIRITFPTGEDFIVAVAKEIKKIGASADSNTIFFDLTEEEIHQIGAALIESYMSESVKVYAVKYVNPNQQLVDEYHIDYIEKYNVALEKLISEEQQIENARAEADSQPVLDDAGNPQIDDITGEVVLAKVEPKKITANDIAIERIAAEANISIDLAEQIRTAIEKNDTIFIRNYSNMVETLPTVLTANYPVNREVALLLAKNPNVVDEIQQKYNAKINTLAAERATLLKNSAYEYERRPDGSIAFVIDEETGLYKEDSEAISAVASGLNAEIDTQKQERQAYIQALLQQSIINEFN